MRHLYTPALLVFVLLSTACGPAEETPKPNNTPTPPAPEMKAERDKVDPGVSCTASACADPKWQRALPSRDTVLIDFGGANARSFGGIHQVTEAPSDAYVELSEHTRELNDLIDDVFLTIEQAGASSPEVEEDGYARWRSNQGEWDVVIELESTDGVDFSIWLGVVATGSDLPRDQAGLTGTITMAEDGSRESFRFELELEEFNELDGVEVNAALEISAEPLDDGLWVLEYALAESSEVEIALEKTTYWIYGEGDGALEYAFVAEDGMTSFGGETYARWGADGGRMDAFVSLEDGGGARWDVVHVNCWDAGGLESFDGLLANQGDVPYAETLGEPDDCVFEVMEGHPSPIDAIALLFATQGWEEIKESAQPFPEDLDLGGLDDDIDPGTPSDCEADAQAVAAEVLACEDIVIDAVSACSAQEEEIAGCAGAILTAANPCEGLDTAACDFLYE